MEVNGSETEPDRSEQVETESNRTETKLNGSEWERNRSDAKRNCSKRNRTLFFVCLFVKHGKTQTRNKHKTYFGSVCFSFASRQICFVPIRFHSVSFRFDWIPFRLARFDLDLFQFHSVSFEFDRVPFRLARFDSLCKNRNGSRMKVNESEWERSRTEAKRNRTYGAAIYTVA